MFNELCVSCLLALDIVGGYFVNVWFGFVLLLYFIEPVVFGLVALVCTFVVAWLVGFGLFCCWVDLLV